MRHVVPVLILALIAIPLGAADCIKPYHPTGLVTFWTFDDGKKTVGDLFGTPNQGSVNGTPDQQTVAIPTKSRAICFLEEDQWVTVPDQDDLDLGTGAFTITFWINPVGGFYPDIQTIIDKRTSSGPLKGYAVFLYQGRVGLQLAVNGSYANYIQPAKISDSGWSFVAISVKRTANAGSGSIYVKAPTANSPLTLTHSFSAKTGSVDNDAMLYIGRHATAGVLGKYSGCLDDIQIIKGTNLKPADLAILLHNAPWATCKGP